MVELSLRVFFCVHIEICICVSLIKLCCNYMLLRNLQCFPLQGIQDEMLLPETPLHLSLDNDQIPFPLECFRRYLLDLKTERNIEDKSSPMSKAINSCLRDMYHYARISGSHVLECVMCAALSSVKKEKLQDASDVGGIG